MSKERNTENIDKYPFDKDIDSEKEQNEEEPESRDWRKLLIGIVFILAIIIIWYALTGSGF